MQSIHFLSLISSFQWVLRDAKNVTSLLCNPDSFVDWEDVVMIKTAVPNCPICLTEPTIPKCTKCGHIYCWTCILQYLQTNYKCPICYQYIGSEDLKSIIRKNNTSFETKQIKMTLLKKNSVRILH